MKFAILISVLLLSSTAFADRERIILSCNENRFNVVITERGNGYALYIYDQSAGETQADVGKGINGVEIEPEDERSTMTLYRFKTIFRTITVGEQTLAKGGRIAVHIKTRLGKIIEDECRAREIL